MTTHPDQSVCHGFVTDIRILKKMITVQQSYTNKPQKFLQQDAIFIYYTKGTFMTVEEETLVQSNTNNMGFNI
jgi:hypothetical protein